jgi:acetylornithine/succinyldiaminopimelate/putrescine aminotransferase
MPETFKIVDPNVLEVGFLRTELLVGLTLTKIAMDAQHRDKIDRNRANARKAYDTVLRFMPRVSITRDEAIEINAKLAKLKSELRELGEEV